MSNNSLVISSLTPQIPQPPSLNLMDCAHLGAYAFYGHHEALNEVFQMRNSKKFLAVCMLVIFRIYNFFFTINTLKR